MKKQWNLSTLLESLHDEIHLQLDLSRKSFSHPGTMGDASESIWIDLFNKYLPTRYQAAKAHVVDSKGNFSDQIDVVIYYRQYSPFIFNFKNEIIIPAESVYAVFESKQSINAEYVKYAQDKIDSVRALHRTSLPIPHAGGIFPAKAPIKIIGGILTFESDWSPLFGKPLENALENAAGTIDMGCVAAHGFFDFNTILNKYIYHPSGKPATSFLFKLISDLQFSGTVPMIDVIAYSQWLNKTELTTDV